MPLLQLCLKHSECSKSASYKTKNTIWFLMLGNDFLYSTIILLTPSATRSIMLGSPYVSPCFGHKRKITIHLSLFTRHYSLVLFIVTVHLKIFCLFKGGCPLCLSKCLFKCFFRASSLERDPFYCKNIYLLTLHTSYLLYLHFFLYKACNS